jgi:predicted GNAT family N-acyltransferase
MMIIRAETEVHREMCYALRRAVFMAEQGVTPADEWDGLEDDCHHFLTLDGATPVATARLRPMGTSAKVQRVAVVKSHRGTGLGDQMMRHMLVFARAQGFASITLEAQTRAIPFYAKLGFTAQGPEFDDAGIAHRRMRLKLR